MFILKKIINIYLDSTFLFVIFITNLFLLFICSLYKYTSRYLFTGKRFLTNHRYYSSIENNNSQLDPWFVTGFSDAEGCFNILVAPTRSSSQNLIKRYYSSRTKTKTRQVKASVVLPKEYEDYKLSPYFITGFSDGEGCFSCSMVENKKLKVGWRVQPSCQIKLHARDLPVLVLIKKFLDAGNISNAGHSAVQFRVQSPKELKKIQKFFKQFNLITRKRADFVLWCKILKLIIKGEHLTIDGLRKIVALKAAMNLSLSDKLKTAFPHVVPFNRPVVELPKTIDPDWLAGFTSAEGSFMINLRKATTKVGNQVLLVYQLSQHKRDLPLMNLIRIILGCGNLYIYRTRIDLRVTKFDDIVNKIIPLFNKHPIRGVKALDYQDFCRVAQLMEDKKHLTQEGLEQIRKIKAGMNCGRKLD